MQLFIDQNVTLFKRGFSVKDELKEDVYYVESEWITSSLYLHIHNMSGKRLLTIKRKTSFITPSCEFIVDHKKIAKMEKEVTFTKPQLNIPELRWHICGEFSGHYYTIVKEGEIIGEVRKEIVNITDSYTLTYTNKRDELYLLGAVLAIDCMLFSGQKSGRLLRHIG